MQFLTKSQITNILHINNSTLNELVNEGKIPFEKIATENGVEIKFEPWAIDNWLKKIPNLSMDNRKYVERFKKRMEEKYPKSLKILQQYNEQFKEPRQPKGYNLAKVKNKKLGFVFYARYIVDGKLVPSRWCTHTNNEQAAAGWAVENRERCLAEYYNRKTVKKPTIDLYSVMKKFYAENSPYLKIALQRGRALGEDSRKVYQGFMTNHWIPYLQKHRIKSFDDIDAHFLSRFQNCLLSRNIKSQTINHYISYISQIFDHLLTEGYVKTNPCKNLPSLKIIAEKEKGCYEITKLKEVFNKKWENEKSYFLCLLIYTTNMRNSEIEKIQVKDIIKMDNYHFIDIPKSKSKNGIRIVPLHYFVYRKLIGYIRKNNFTEEDYLFSVNGRKLGSGAYYKAYTELAKYTGYSIEKLKEENITFYSGRHFWKTLTNSEELGDIEEYLMGHKVSSDVTKRYNHRDKQGRKKLYEKVEKLFSILDKYIFR
jgi:integrase